MSLDAKRTLVFAVLKFLRTEIEHETTNADLKESLEVASQCLESCYEVSLDDEICKNNFDSGLDLLDIAGKSVIKREIPDDLKEKANVFKNEGNDLMKSEKFKEALDAYNKAIEIDKNNAVFYCNRAAAYSKLSDFTNSIEDCKTALKIDPTYSKAWGRLGLALLSNNQIEESFEAYNKAVQLEPANEGYKQNLKIVEEKLKNASPGASGMPDLGALGGLGGMGNFMNMFNNPQFINMASQLMSDPQMQNLMTNIIGNMATQVPGAAAPAGPTPPGAAPSADTQEQPNPLFPQPGVLPGDLNNLLTAGQRFAQQMSSMNPDLVNQLRTQMGFGGPGGPGNNPNGNDPSNTQ